MKANDEKDKAIKKLCRHDLLHIADIRHKYRKDRDAILTKLEMTLAPIIQNDRLWINIALLLQ